MFFLTNINRLSQKAEEAVAEDLREWLRKEGKLFLIMEKIQKGASTISEISKKLKINRKIVEYSLKQLKNAGIVVIQEPCKNRLPRCGRKRKKFKRPRIYITKIFPTSPQGKRILTDYYLYYLFKIEKYENFLKNLKKSIFDIEKLSKKGWNVLKRVKEA
jgi:predicted transcriptional regulator